MMTIEAPAKERYLKISDRCDKCYAQAFVLVKFINGNLYFCGHHFAKNELQLIESSYEIIDEREYINKKSESSN